VLCFFEETMMATPSYGDRVLTGLSDVYVAGRDISGVPNAFDSLQEDGVVRMKDVCVSRDSDIAK